MSLDRYGKLIVALFVSLFVALVFSQSDKKFVLDELDFPIVAKATSETLKPIYYRGEGQEEHLGLYHPPLYIYMLSAHIKAFGFSENSVRSFGLLSVLITAILTAILGVRISSTRSPIYLPIFVALYLSHPYTIANTTLPDIDQSILPPLIILYLILLFDNRKDWLLALAFTFLLWAKLTTPLVLIPFSMLYWYFGEKSIDGTLSRSIRVFGGATIVFLCSYLIYCKLTNLPFGYTADFLLHSFTKGSGATELSVVYNKIVQNFSYSSGFLEWVMYPFVCLFVLSLILSIPKCCSDSAVFKTLGLGVLTIFVTIFYCGLIPPFGGFFKYPFPVFQLACLVISIAIASRLQVSSLIIKFSAGLGAILAIFVFVFQTKYLGDHRLLANFIEASFVENVAPIFLLLIVAFLFSILSKNVAAIVLSLMVGCQVGLAVGVSRNHAISVYPTKYNYGQLGFDDTVAYLKQKLEPGEVIWSMKDIGYYSGNKYVESYSYYFDKKVESKIISLSSSGMRYFVATRDVGEDRLDAYPAVLAALNECCSLEKNFGNYYIYRKK
jgi:hypothetical protein